MATKPPDFIVGRGFALIPHSVRQPRCQDKGSRHLRAAGDLTPAASHLSRWSSPLRRPHGTRYWGADLCTRRSGGEQDTNPGAPLGRHDSSLRSGRSAAYTPCRSGHRSFFVPAAATIVWPGSKGFWSSDAAIPTHLLGKANAGFAERDSKPKPGDDRHGCWLLPASPESLHPEPCVVRSASRFE